MNIFEEASRKKLRFQTQNGSLHTEDLWDVPLTSKTGKVNLNDIARTLFQKIKDSEEVSFVEENQKIDPVLSLSFDIVKSIINTRLEENKNASELRALKDQEQTLLTLLQQKETEALASKTPEELRAMLAELAAKK